VGKKYCWGGVGPECFDCSGLVQQAWLSAGVPLPRTADAMAFAAPEVRLDELETGDVLWWPGHVGIYAGQGWVIDAYDKRHGVVRRPAKSPRRAFRP
jgi:cell wall-associated NlpC family hydrolase